MNRGGLAGLQAEHKARLDAAMIARAKTKAPGYTIESSPTPLHPRASITDVTMGNDSADPGIVSNGDVSNV